MGPNDAEVARVFTREAGGTIADVSFPFNKDIEVVVEAEAGNAIFNTGGQFSIKICVRDLCNFKLVKVKNGTLSDILIVPGAFGAAPWNALAQQFVFTIPKAELGPAKDGAIMEVLVCLQVGIATVDASFARSSLFHIHKP